jgi:hypothetical protein
MKKLVLFVALAAVFGLSFISCSSDKKSGEVTSEKENTENIQQEASDLSGNATESVQSSQQQ